MPLYVPKMDPANHRRTHYTASPVLLSSLQLTADLSAPWLSATACWPAHEMQGNKQAVGIVYTPWSNLKKTKAMEVGQVRGGPWTAPAAPCPVHLLDHPCSTLPCPPPGQIAKQASRGRLLCLRQLAAGTWGPVGRLHSLVTTYQALPLIRARSMSD